MSNTWRQRRGIRRAVAATAAATFAVGLSAVVQTAHAATNGTTVVAGLTKPAGGAWLPGPAGGHYWTPDNVLGFLSD